MANILLWPDLYREHGHWLPAVNLAKSLKDAGHTVNFMGIVDCESIVSPYLAGQASFFPIFESIYPAGHTVEDKIEPIGHRWKPEHLLPLIGGALDGIFTGPSRPDLLVSGYFNSLETLLIHHKYDIPFVTLTTYLRHPQETPDSFALMKLLYLSRPLQVRLLTGVGVDPDAVELEDFVAPLQPTAHPELIPCARDFDFFDEDWEHGPGVTYVEPMIRRLALDGSDPVEVPTSDATQIFHPIPSNKKLIYATSGSQVSDYEDKARQFFKSLIAMMKLQGLEDYHLVLAMGDKLLSEFRIAYGLDAAEIDDGFPENVTIASWVSQQEIMDQTKVAFIHGGLATIKEAIWSGVPIVILPHGKDQLENALRIERSGVGILPETQNADANELKRLMTLALSSGWVKGRVAQMQGLFRGLDDLSPKPSVNIIEDVLSA